MPKLDFTKEQWINLIEEFNYRCVRCGLQGYNLDKDHIIPLYQGGNSKIDNIQPLCAWCNSSKGPENFNWKELRRLKGWSYMHDKYPPTHPYRKKYEIR